MGELDPMLSAPSSTATGGAAPAINPTTRLAAAPFGASGALISCYRRSARRPLWVTPCLLIRSNIRVGSTLRRQTLTPAAAAMVQESTSICLHSGHHAEFPCNVDSVLSSMAAAAGVNVCLRKVEPTRIFDLIRRHGVTHMGRRADRL